MDIGIVYHIDTPQQFWAELEDILYITSDTSLAGIDYALTTFVIVCANNHDRFLQTNAQLDHACEMILDSELFGVHSQRSTEHIVNDAKSNLDPHCQLILYKILLHYGFRHPSFFRNLRKWSQLLPFLMDHVIVEIDETPHYTGSMGIGVPIESRLGTISVILLYEICRVQKIDSNDLKLFTDAFVTRLFDLVEETRVDSDETLNYALIRLIVALNEQFMVASLTPPSHRHSPTTQNGPVPRIGSPARTGRESPVGSAVQNKVLTVLMRRLGESTAFGQNLIFMLNRAENTPEDLCMQLLVLKLLYLLFTTPATQEYFYTNDLRVLVDVFIRELVDLPEDSDSLRHTYLRVLHPLMTNTQLRSHPYKRLQVRNVLQSLVAHANIRDVTPTVRRLVERCLRAAWCKEVEAEMTALEHKVESQSVDSGLRGKGGSAVSNDTTRPPAKTVHRSSSMTFTQGSGPGLRRNPSKSSTMLSVRDSTAGSSDTGRVPRSADANSAEKTFANEHTVLERKTQSESQPTVVPLHELQTLSLDDPSGSPSQESPVEMPTQHSLFSIANSATITIITPTPTDEKPLPPRPRASSTTDRPIKGKTPPPPRPPPFRKRKSSDRLYLDSEVPSRSNSLGEVTRTGVDSEDRIAATSIERPQLVHAVADAEDIRRSAPSTPPPKRRKAPAPPKPRNGTTMTTIASSNPSNVGLEVPVGRWAVPS